MTTQNSAPPPDFTEDLVIPSCEVDVATFNQAATTSTETIDPTAETRYYVRSIGAAKIHTITLSAVTIADEPCPITIKRSDNNTNSTIRIQSGQGIDGAAANRISLGTSTAFGIQSGESVTLLFDGTTWRVI